MEQIPASYLFNENARVQENASLAIRDGRIDRIDNGVSSPAKRSLIIPALINAHDHARPRLSSFGAIDMPLESWILRSALATPPDPYLVAASALGRSAKAGCGGMMIHYTRPSGKLTMVEEAQAISRAAKDVGLRLAFAPALRDQNPVVYGDTEEFLNRLPVDTAAVVREIFVKPPAEPRQLITITEEVAAAIEGPTVDVQFGPAGVQWCSRKLLEGIAEASALTGRRIHMHLLETRYQRQWADREFPGGIVEYLRDIGLLSPRLTLAHCVHVTPAEQEIIAASGSRIVTNFSSNLHLGSGIAPIGRAYRCGCPICVGVDGLALDEDDDILREMRLVRLAHRGEGFPANWTAAEFLSHVVTNGRAAIGAPGDGLLRPSAPADFIILDYDLVDQDRFVELDPICLLFTRGNRTMVKDVFVAGRRVVENGRLNGIDLSGIEEELRRQYRANLGYAERLREGWPAIDAEISQWFLDHQNCS